MRPVTAEQISNAIISWNLIYPQPVEEEVLMAKAAEYWRILLDAGVSETEFKILKRYVDQRCEWFPLPAQILKGREEFIDYIFEPTAADKEALVYNPDYKYGRRKVVLKEEIIEEIDQDYGDRKQIGGGFGSLLKSIE